MDILDIKPDTVSVDIKHPGTGEPVGIVIECVSLDSPECKAVERRIRNKALRGGRGGLTAEQVEENTVALLAAAIVSWAWDKDVVLGGLKDPPCTTENKAKVLAVSWIARQIDAALADEAAFFRMPAST